MRFENNILKCTINQAINSPSLIEIFVFKIRNLNVLKIK